MDMKTEYPVLYNHIEGILYIYKSKDSNAVLME